MSKPQKRVLYITLNQLEISPCMCCLGIEQDEEGGTHIPTHYIIDWG